MTKDERMEAFARYHEHHANLFERIGNNEWARRRRFLADMWRKWAREGRYESLDHNPDPPSWG